MSKNKIVEMAILTTLSDIALKEIMEDLDNTFAPMGAGGYSVRKHPKMNDVFIFTQCDCAPARGYLVGIKGKEIWTTTLSGYIASVLISNKIPFKITYRDFSDSKEADIAFQS